MSTPPRDRIAGSIYGLAYGDALGYQVEFDSFNKIINDHGYALAMPEPALISDDTQMSLALWQALDVADIADDADLIDTVTAAFVAWKDDPENWRAPGGTCMTALGALQRGTPWRQATVGGSKGCGTVMRVPWVGLHPRVAPEQISRVAQLQAALTHGHPTAVIAADVLAHLTYELATDALDLEYAAPRAFELANSLDYQPVLGELWRESIVDDRAKRRRRKGRKGRRPITPKRLLHDAADFCAVGGYETAEAVAKVSWAADELAQAYDTDPCELTGEGWIAEEALATALLCTTTYHDRPEVALRRAASTGGDSDSIAAVAGALLGAAHGDCWPESWRGLLEPRYARELAQAATSVAV